jgi:hypothetical protein
MWVKRSGHICVKKEKTKRESAQDLEDLRK